MRPFDKVCSLVAEQRCNTDDPSACILVSDMTNCIGAHRLLRYGVCWHVAYKYGVCLAHSLQVWLFLVCFFVCVCVFCVPLYIFSLDNVKNVRLNLP